MIRMKRKMLYDRYIIFYDSNYEQELLAIDIDTNKEQKGSNVYLWQMQSGVPERHGYDCTCDRKLKVIGVDLYDQ